MRKRRTREHIIADLSINHVERFALRCGYVTDRVLFDYGYDLILRTFDEIGEIEPDFLFIQLKASDATEYREERRFVSVRIDERDVIAWRSERAPVILITYDAQEDVAYWVHVQVLRLDGAKSVRIPTSQRMDENAIRELRRLKNDTFRGL
jgi:hypothetical protein